MDSHGEGSPARRSSGRPGHVSIELAMGTAIEARRLERQMTLCGLADATKIPQPLLAEYEAGTTRAGSVHVLAIADALGVGLGQLFRLHPGFTA